MEARIKKIKVLAVDVDGVLSDGRIVYDSDGRELKFFNVQDGFGLVLMRRLGFKTAIITARGSKVVEVRAADLKIDRVFQNAFPKMAAYEQMLAEFGVSDEEVCFIGDDLPDLRLLERAGFAVAVANATPEAKSAAHYVTRLPGGHGAVREAVDLILHTQGKWDQVLQAI